MIRWKLDKQKLITIDGKYSSISFFDFWDWKGNLIWTQRCYNQKEVNIVLKMITDHLLVKKILSLSIDSSLLCFSLANCIAKEAKH